MKFTVVLPYTRRSRHSDSPMQRPYLHNAYKVVSEIVGESVTISFEQGVLKGESGRVDFGHLTTFPRVITEKNVDAVLELVGDELDVNRKPDLHTLPVVEALLTAKGWNNDRENYDMLDGQEGWGFMGGTGCGALVHKLRYTKVLGVKPEHVGVRRVLAAMQFNAWLGQVKAIRAENAHLREAVSADELFVTYNAHPICQATVRHFHARGFLVGKAGAEHCSCTKCAAKLGITANRRRKGIDIKTPDVMEVGGLTFTHVLLGGRSVLNVTTAAGKLVDRKTLNAAIKERGQRLAHTDSPLAIRGIWYVEALKESTADMLVLKMERGSKDSLFAQARILADKGILLQKGA
jgi:hypothetical protein